MFVFEGASVHDLVQPLQRLLSNGPPWSLSFGVGIGGGPGEPAAPGTTASALQGSPAARQLRQALQRTDGAAVAAFWKAQLLGTAGTLVQVRARARRARLPTAPAGACRPRPRPALPCAAWEPHARACARSASPHPLALTP